jgi:hypothetical protein
MNLTNRIHVAALGSAIALLASAPLGPAQKASTGKNGAWPDPLVEHNGAKIRDAAEFVNVRRPEIFHDFEENVYGRTPDKKIQADYRVTSVDPHALGGAAVRKQITITFRSGSIQRDIHLLLYLPADSAQPAPVFIGLNFRGNQSVSTDPGIELSNVWIPDPALEPMHIAKELEGHVMRRTAENTRGADAHEWPIEEIVRAGYGLATVYAGDIEPDFALGIGYGIRPLFFEEGKAQALDDWGAIGAWAWGMSRIADYLETDKAVNGGQLIAMGFSRFGKTALWAGAQDKRFAAVISNESGQGGAGLAHREAAETITHLNMSFPHWFSANYHRFSGRPDQLPIDGHLLLALIAPRPLLVASAVADPYSDPEGEFLASVAATPVYRLFGKEGLPADAKYEADRVQGKTLRYYVRPGGHDMLLSDWKRFIQFANETVHQAGQ